MSIIVEQHKLLRAEDLLAPEYPEKFIELIEGELVMSAAAGWEHNQIGYRIQKLFDEFCRDRPGLAFGFGNDGFIVHRDPDTMLSPDASLFRRRAAMLDATWLEFTPEIAVEVLSPSNNEAEIAFKRGAYFEGGAEQVWIVDPRLKRIEMHHREGKTVTAQGDETVVADGIAEGLKIDLRELFRPG
jgi:Uma2 family endonuclease